MKKIYYFIFYSIYSIIKWTPNKDIAEWVAAILMAVFVVFNTFCLLYLTNIYNTDMYKESAKEILIVFFFLILFMNIMLFLKGKRYESIINEYSRLDKNTKLFGKIGVFLYVTFSVLLLLYVVNIM